MTSSASRAAAALALGITLVACSTGGLTSVDAGAPDSAPDAPIGAVTYYGDVRPILAANCVVCHSDGAIAPFALDSYQGSRSVAPLIATATRNRTMPPYLVDASGSCNAFPSSRWLTDREIAVLAAWNAQGTPEGDPSTPAPVIPPGPTLGGTITTLTTPTYAPMTGTNDDYRCFVIDAPAIASDYFVTGYDFQPGNPSIVHHAALLVPTDDASNAMLPMLDDAAPGPGYPCYGGPGVNALFVVGWGPGMGPVELPTHTGVGVTAGYRYVLQIHYNTAAAMGMSDSSTMRLETTTSGVTQAVMLPVGNTDLSLPPHMNAVAATSEQSLQTDYGFPSLPVRAYGIFPHMHQLGTSMSMEVVHADGTTSCLGQVPRWDFNWQRAYFYESPVQIRPTDRLRLTCTFDTRSRTDITTFGEDTTNEMCFGVLYISI